MTRPITILTLPVVASLLMTGCSDNLRRDIGLERTAPDEFQVVRRKPLIVPPDASLRPPGAGVSSSETLANEAEGIVTGTPAVTASRASASERALLQTTQVEAMPDIRKVILEEGSQLRQLDEDRFLFVLNFQRRAAERRVQTPIDPLAEAQRLEEEGIAQKVITIRTGGTQSTGAGS